MDGHGKTLALTSDGDLKINELGQAEYVDGNHAVLQGLKVTLMTVRGEDPFDEGHGLDIFHVAGGDEARLRLEIIRALNNDPQVEEVHQVDVQWERGERASRNAHASITLSLVDGETYSFPVIVDAR